MSRIAGALRKLYSRISLFKPEATQRWGDPFFNISELTTPRLFQAISAETVAALHEKMPEQVVATIAAAERILQHEFDLLGSGAYRPGDIVRASGNGYIPIDWNLDPVSGLRFPSGLHYKNWDLWKMRPGQADIKLPWELARCQHWITLAQAWLLTGDVRYADEIIAERVDFDEANPVGYGIHWTCTMDVAIRAANWALALEMIHAHALSDDLRIEAYRSLFEHGRFIRANLEDKYEVTSNHFLSNVVGLFYLAQVFGENPEAQEWDEFSRVAIEKEAHVQILPDGADFESSVPYHRLVAELFLGAVNVAKQSGRPLSDELQSRLKNMADFLCCVLRPDGLMPQLGDADDGRLHIFTDYGAWKPQDGRHLLASAAHVLDVPEWLSHAGAKGQWEAFWWGGGLDDAALSNALPAVDQHFPDAGIVIHRSTKAYLAISNGIVGTKGFGNHKHNDLLSFEFHAAGTPLIVDPGSYVYTSDMAARNLFRSTAYHSTLMIDGVEQNEVNPEWLFRLFEKASPETVAYRVTQDALLYHGRHFGYTRLEYPLIHERIFKLSLEDTVLTITDSIKGDGHHRLRWHFHLAPDIDVTLEHGQARLLQQGADVYWRLSFPDGLKAAIASAWYSPSYGVRLPCHAIELEAEASLVQTSTWVFALTSERMH